MLACSARCRIPAGGGRSHWPLQAGRHCRTRQSFACCAGAAQHGPSGGTGSTSSMGHSDSRSDGGRSSRGSSSGSSGRSSGVSSSRGSMGSSSGRSGGGRSLRSSSTPVQGRASNGGRGARTVGQGSATPLQPRLIDLITSADSIGQLASLVEQYGATLPHLHVAAALVRATKVHGGDKASAVALADRLLQRALPMLPRYGAREAANILHAMAKLDMGRADELAALLGHLLQHIGSAEPQHVSNALWALATLATSGAAGAAAVQGALTTRPSAVGTLLGRLLDVRDAIPQHGSNPLWALAVLSAAGDAAAASAHAAVTTDSLMCSLLERARALAPSMNAQNVANSLWACGQLGVTTSASSSALQEVALQQLQQMSPQGLANMALGAAKLAQPGAAAVVAGAVRQAAERVDARGAAAGGGFRHQHLANLCWAAAVAGLPVGGEPGSLLPALRVLCAALAQHRQRALEGAVLVDENMQQLYQLWIWAADSSASPGALMPPSLLQRCEQAWRQQIEAQRRQELTGYSSRSTVGQVFTALQALQRGSSSSGISLQDLGREVLTPDEVFCVDIAAQVQGQVAPLAIEVDGPTHFVRRLEQQQSSGSIAVAWLPNGETAFRNAALRHRGYQLAVIPFHEWDTLRGAQQQAAYLQRSLQAAATMPVPRPEAGASSSQPTADQQPSRSRGSRRGSSSISGGGGSSGSDAPAPAARSALARAVAIRAQQTAAKKRASQEASD